MRCTCTPAELNVAPNAMAVAEVRFTIPATSPGLHQTRLLTVAVDEHGRAPVTTTITVEQEGLPARHTGLARRRANRRCAVGYDVASKPLALTDPSLKSLPPIASARMRLDPEVVYVPERRRR